MPLFLASCFLFALFTSCAFSIEPKLPKFAPLDFKLPKAKRTELSNKTVIYTLEDRTLPIIRISVFIKGGSIYDPKDKIGLSSIFASAWTRSGTKHLKADDLTRELELMGSSISASEKEESINVYLFTLKENLDKTLALFSQWFVSPVFENKKIDIEKNKVLENIRRRNDEPMTIARREIARAVYGKDSPWGRRTEIETIKAIKRKDLFEMHKNFIAPERAILAISGDFDTIKLLQKLEKKLGSLKWKNSAKPLPVINTVINKNTKRVIFIEKTSTEQTAIRMANFGIKRSSKDHFRFSMMNEIFGGGYSSRLFTRIRSRQGLAYYCVSGFTQPADFGLFVTAIGTKNQTVIKTINAVLEEIKEIQESQVSSQEMEIAKNQLTAHFIQEFSTPISIARKRALVEFYDYPDGWLDAYVSNIAAVTKTDVLKAANKYLDPENMTTLIVGNPDKSEGNLDSLGSIEKIKP
ncbi:M16 family metallopeptidase [Elusimicrobiota bacterium]